MSPTTFFNSFEDDSRFFPLVAAVNAFIPNDTRFLTVSSENNLPFIIFLTIALALLTPPIAACVNVAALLTTLHTVLTILAAVVIFEAIFPN